MFQNHTRIISVLVYICICLGTYTLCVYVLSTFSSCVRGMTKKAGADGGGIRLNSHCVPFYMYKI